MYATDIFFCFLLSGLVNANSQEQNRLGLVCVSATKHTAQLAILQNPRLVRPGTFVPANRIIRPLCGMPDLPLALGVFAEKTLQACAPDG